MLTEFYRDRLLRLLRAAVVYGDVTLSAGGRSDWYVDVRRVALSAEGSFLLGRLFADHLARLVLPRGDNKPRFDCVAGVVLGGVPLAAALLGTLGSVMVLDCRGCMVRVEPKGHGVAAGSRLAGDVRAGDLCVVLDDVLTSGRSLVSACEAVESAGAHVIHAAVVVDRSTGPNQGPLAWRWSYSSLFRATDLGVHDNADASGKD